MRRTLGAWALLWLGVIFLSHADAYWQTRLQISAGFSPSCTENTNWLARATGVTSAIDKQNYDNLICGMVADGDFASFDAIYLYTAVDTTTAALSIVSATYNSTVNGSCTFTAYQGYTGNATDCYLATGFVPSSASSPKYVKDSGTLATCILSSRTTDQNWFSGGSFNANRMLIEPLAFGTMQWAINSGAGVVVNTNTQGFWTATRTGATASVIYKNGTSFATDVTPSTGVDNVQTVFLARNDNPPAFFTGDQHAVGMIGAGLSGAAELRVYNRMYTYLAAYGLSGC